MSTCIVRRLLFGLGVFLQFLPFIAKAEECDAVSFDGANFKICGQFGGSLRYELWKDSTKVLDGNFSNSYQGEAGLDPDTYSSHFSLRTSAMIKELGLDNAKKYRVNLLREPRTSFQPRAILYEYCTWNHTKRGYCLQEDFGKLDSRCWQCNQPWKQIGSYQPK